MSILVVGSLGLDTVKTPFGKVKDVLGGSASYFSYAASLSSPVSLIAVVGEDFPDAFINEFHKKNIATQGVARMKGKTFSWSGEYDWDMNDPKTLSTQLGVFSKFKPKIPAEYKKCKYVFLANIDPDLQRNISRQVKGAKIIACDTMNFWIENKRKKLLKLLKDVTIFFINESEARQLTCEPNILKAARAILKMGPKKVFIKRGEHGVLLVSGRIIFSTPAYLMESIIDPTGAGDTFAGGVIGYLSKSKRINSSVLKTAAIQGTIMATFAVEGFSLDSLKTVNLFKIKNRFKKFRKLTSF